MAREGTRGALLLLAISACGGCAGTGNSFGLFPERSEMIESAKQIRQTSPAPLPRELSKVPLDSYIVEPGDGLLILPSELDSPVRLPSDQTILPDGTIDLGKYGRPMVAGKTVPEIEAVVNEMVARKTKDAGSINVRLVNRVSKVYYVLGEVNSPGAFPLQGRETVLDGIIAAGNLNGGASKKNIILVRPSHPEGCRTVLAICYPEIVQLGDTSTNYQLRPGDRIYVPTAGFFESLSSHLKKAPCVTCAGPHHPCEGAPTSIELPGAQVSPPAEIVPTPVSGKGVSVAPTMRRK
jgi:protein involved in polysaccharide export with SLBB domain